MTYVLAWVDKAKGSAYIVADSATTYEYENGRSPLSNQRPKSTFLESQIYSENIAVVESSLKIIRIDSKTVLAYAGDSNSLREIRKHLALLVRLKPGIPIKDLLQQCLDQDDYQDIQLVIAVMHEGSPKLVTYNSDGKRQIYDHEKVIHLGSLVNKRPDVTSEYLAMVVRLVTRQNEVPTKYILTYMMTFMQTFSLHNVLMEANVGGIISGIELNKNGAHWPSDRSFLLYNGQTSNMIKLFRIIYRHDALGVLTVYPETEVELVIANESIDIDVLEKAMGVGQTIYLHEILETDNISLMSVSDQRAIIIPKEINEREGLIELTISKENSGKQLMHLVIKRTGISDYMNQPLETGLPSVRICD